MRRFAQSVALDLPAISQLTERASDFLEEAGVDRRAAHHVALTLDELLTNASTHGGAAGLQAQVSLDVAPDRVRVEILDPARPFDPRSGPPVDVDAPLDEREMGGLGLHLVIKLSQDLQYSRDNGRNRTSYWVRRQGSDDQLA